MLHRKYTTSPRKMRGVQPGSTFTTPASAFPSTNEGITNESLIKGTMLRE
jgi:hypothetical protein